MEGILQTKIIHFTGFKAQNHKTQYAKMLHGQNDKDEFIKSAANKNKQSSSRPNANLDDKKDKSSSKIRPDILDKIDELKDCSQEEIDAKLTELNVGEEWIKRLSGQFTTLQYAVFMQLKTMDFNDKDACSWSINTSIDGFNKLNTLIDANLSLDTIKLLSDWTGPNFENLDKKQIEALKSLDETGLEELTSLANEGWISDIKNAIDKYDTYNLILNGSRLDTNLANRVKQIGRQYDIEIKLDNNAVSQEYTGNAHNFVSVNEEYLKCLDEMLAQISTSKANKLKTVYLTNFLAYSKNGQALGGFCSKNPEEMVININIKKNQLNFLKQVIYHELTHMEDWVQTGTHGYYRSKKNGAKLGIQPNASLDNLSLKYNNRFTLTGNDISAYIRDYATTNIREFVAEVGALLKSGVIAKDTNGYYAIDKANTPPIYCKNWNNLTEDYQKLNMIVQLYNYLTQE